jgi:CDP-paratose 2-epimerase
MAKILITGGAGFIGARLARQLLSEGHGVTIFDNFSRLGTELRVGWLREHCNPENQLQVIRGDVADFDSVLSAASGVQRIYHLAGQVSVTGSVQNPLQDFFDNAQGTLNALESARRVGDDPIFIYASTNKVYGGLENLPIGESSSSYYYEDARPGISETQAIDFRSPYGCSKGCGDQYALDYFRVYGLRTVVMRQSCVYGTWQLGTEDQGWVAWFMLAALRGDEITIYGDGKQVRDLLFVEDLVESYALAAKNIDRAAGKVYNIGGGAENKLSVWREFGPMLEQMLGRSIPVRHAHWRPADQKIYVSDIGLARIELQWSPRVPFERGLQILFDWLRDNLEKLPRSVGP